jgi:type III secretory pathway component EscR
MILHLSSPENFDQNSRMLFRPFLSKNTNKKNMKKGKKEKTKKKDRTRQQKQKQK